MKPTNADGQSGRLDGLLRAVSSGRISRRRFMQSAMAAGMTATAATTLAARAMASTPKRGGHMTIGLGHGSTSDSLDPAAYENGYQIVLTHAIHNYLAEVQADGTARPELAEAIEPSADAATWTIRLRDSVEFHDGRPLTSDDAIASLNHHRGETKSAAKSLLAPVTDIRKRDRHTLTVELEAGNADFPFLLSDYHLAIKPAEEGMIDPQSAIGTGGYVLAEHEPGVRSRLERFPNYFKDDRAFVDEAELVSIIDPAARTNALKTGDVDVIDRCDPKTVDMLDRRPGVKVRKVTGTRHYTFPMRTDTAPFDDNEVRLALKYALDRDAIVKTVLRGHGTKGNDHPIAPGQRFHADDLAQRAYDPDRARHHLRKAGYRKLRVPLHAAEAAFPGAVDAAVLYREHAAEAGIMIDVVREPDDGYWTNVWRKKPWCACYWSGRPTADWMLSTAYAGDAAWNDTYWDHDRFDKLLRAARAELDAAKRQAMYADMQRIVRDDGGTVVPMFADYVFAMRGHVHHGPLAANMPVDGARLVERWWVA